LLPLAWSARSRSPGIGAITDPLRKRTEHRDPDFEAKKNRILRLYGLMDSTVDVHLLVAGCLSGWPASASYSQP
jgi:hypothetical protein